MNEKFIRKSSSGLDILGTDFDGTLFLFSDNYPKVGEPVHKVHDYVKVKQDQGWWIILWTCRENKDLKLALDKCEEYGLKFDYVNENHPEIIRRTGYNSRKLYSTIYLDDRSINPLDL